MPAAFDFDAYCERIGYSGGRTASLETLRGLHFHHPQAIPFENLNPLLRLPVLLDPSSLQQKLIHDRRGGYCYEQNSLFKHALETIGFRVAGLAARVVWNMSEEEVGARTHMLLRIDMDGESYLADVGFGGLTLTSPLRLEMDVEQSTPHEPFRLIRDRDEFVMQARIADTWKPLYRFSLQEQLLPDYEMANWYVSSHPKSRFVNRLIAAKAARDRRYALSNNEFTVHYIDGKTERRRLTTGAEIRQVLEDPLGLALPSSPQLDATLERLAKITG